MKASELTFGIEIECYLPQTLAHQFPVGSYHRGLQIPGFPSGWNAQADSSVTTHAPSGYFGIEIVSPVLSGEAGLCQVADVLVTLNELQAKSTEACGIHVHIGAADFTEDELQRIIRAFQRYEMAFFALNGNQMNARLTSHYCAPSTRWDGTRYQSLNTTNLGTRNKNTIEFRLFCANLQPEFAVAGIYMVTALVSRMTETTIKCKTEQLTPQFAVKRFVHDHFSGENATKYTILPDEDPADVAEFLTAKLGEAVME
jgi:hypothetical protein